MQYIKREILKYKINNHLYISFLEHNGSLSKREIKVNAFENNKWLEKNISYIEKLDFFNNHYLIQQWQSGIINSDELLKNIKNLFHNSKKLDNLINFYYFIQI